MDLERYRAVRQFFFFFLDYELKFLKNIFDINSSGIFSKLLQKDLFLTFSEFD